VRNSYGKVAALVGSGLLPGPAQHPARHQFEIEIRQHDLVDQAIEPVRIPPQRFAIGAQGVDHPGGRILDDLLRGSDGGPDRAAAEREHQQTENEYFLHDRILIAVLRMPTIDLQGVLAGGDSPAAALVSIRPISFSSTSAG
jgi:hypothetical protein